MKSSFGNDQIKTIIFCLFAFFGGCSEEIDIKLIEEDPESDRNNTKNEQDLMAKAVHDDLMSKQKVRWQKLNLVLEDVQAQRLKLLSELEKFDELKVELAATQEERDRVINEAQNFRASSQTAASSQGNANAQAINQLKASNSQLSSLLATSEQRVEQLQVSVSRMQNPANMLKIRQLNLEKTFLSNQLAGREQEIKDLQESINDQQNKENLNIIRKLETQNKTLSQSLDKSKQKVKDLETSLNKPRSQGESNLIKNLKSQNTQLANDLNKCRQQLAKKLNPPKDIVKTLSEWKTKLKKQGIMNMLPSAAELAASIGKPHDQKIQIPSADYQESTYIWRDLVKVNLEIHLVDGKIEMVTHESKIDE